MFRRPVEGPIMFGKSRKKKDPEADPSTLVPRIKTHQFTKALRDMDIPADQMPYTEPLVADLLVAYAFDLPDLFMMASREAIANLGVPKADLRKLALTNLKRQLPEIGVAEHGPVRRVVTGENLEACILLASKFWDEIAGETDGEVVAVVPTRDDLLFCGSESEEGVDALRIVAEELVGEGDTHALSDRLLVWRDGWWAEFDE
jgi:uncharacterized protein YtpQ (UPF0354 family)